MKKKKIAFFIPNLGGGGAERVVSNLTIGLDSRKYDKYIIMYKTNKVVYPYDAKLIDLGSKRRKNIFANVWSHLERIKNLKEIKKNYKFDVVISFLAQPNVQNILTKGDEKVIISVRNYISKRYDFIKKIKAKILYKKADLVISVSEVLKKDLIKNFNIKSENVEVIYNPYNIENIDRLSNESIDEKYKKIFDKKVIMTIGSLTYQKGQWHLIRAFSKLLEREKKLNLVIIGKGELEKKLKNLVKELHIEENVFFLGFQKNPFKYLKKSFLFVFPSLYEGFPNALVEAMACGVPVIATDCKSGPREILAPKDVFADEISYDNAGEYGVLIKAPGMKEDINGCILTQEEELLAEKILYLLDNDMEYRKIQKKSLKRVKDFSMNKIINKWEKIFK
ncbi:MAG: glycosyltransferase [Firmicutes bacterium]|nr:glycosyltransferase [Bacillota bacterium]